MDVAITAINADSYIDFLIISDRCINYFLYIITLKAVERGNIVCTAKTYPKNKQQNFDSETI